jgi:hypothetical protein
MQKHSFLLIQAVLSVFLAKPFSSGGCGEKEKKGNYRATLAM